MHGDEKGNRIALANFTTSFIPYFLVNTPVPKVAPSVVDLVHAADASVLESKGVKPAHRFEVSLKHPHIY